MTMFWFEIVFPQLLRNQGHNYRFLFFIFTALCSIPIKLRKDRTQQLQDTHQENSLTEMLNSKNLFALQSPHPPPNTTPFPISKMTYTVFAQQWDSHCYQDDLTRAQPCCPGKIDCVDWCVKLTKHGIKIRLTLLPATSYETEKLTIRLA